MRVPPWELSETQCLWPACLVQCLHNSKNVSTDNSSNKDELSPQAWDTVWRKPWWKASIWAAGLGIPNQHLHILPANEASELQILSSNLVCLRFLVLSTFTVNGYLLQILCLEACLFFVTVHRSGGECFPRLCSLFNKVKESCNCISLWAQYSWSRERDLKRWVSVYLILGVPYGGQPWSSPVPLSPQRAAPIVAWYDSRFKIAPPRRLDKRNTLWILGGYGYWMRRDLGFRSALYHCKASTDLEANSDDRKARGRSVLWDQGSQERQRCY